MFSSLSTLRNWGFKLLLLFISKWFLFPHPPLFSPIFSILICLINWAVICFWFFRTFVPAAIPSVHRFSSLLSRFPSFVFKANILDETAKSKSWNKTKWKKKQQRPWNWIPSEPISSLHAMNDYLKFCGALLGSHYSIYEYLMNIAIYQLSNGNVGQVPKLIMYTIRTHWTAHNLRADECQRKSLFL